MKILPIIIALLCLLHTSCLNDEDDNGGDDNDGSVFSTEDITGPFFTLEDYARPSEIEKIEADKALKSISDASFIFANAPEDESTPVSLCIEKEIAKTAVQASKSKASLAGSIKVNDCLDVMNTELESAKITDTLINFYLEVLCEVGDLSSLNGKTNEELTDEGNFIDLCSEKISHLGNFEYKFYMKNTVKEDTGGEFIRRSFQGNANNEHCVMTIDQNVLKPSGMCSHINLEYWTKLINEGNKVGDDYSEYLSLTSSTIESTIDKTSQWHNSGIINVVSNNWTGTLTYSSPDEDPAYELSNGVHKATGALNPDNYDD